MTSPPGLAARAGTRLLQGALLALPPAAIAVQGWGRRWMSDDGYIHLRVAQQLLDGNGLVFNAGERVEATTSPLWVLLLGGLRSVVRSVELPWLGVAVGLGASVLGLIAAELGAARLLRADGRTRMLVPAGALVVAALPPFWDYATSGLETGLTFAWLGGSFWLVAVYVTTEPSARSGAKPLVAAAIGLGWLIRPDLILFTIAFLVALLAHEWRWGWRHRLLLGAAAAVVPVAYQVFRMGYYALLVPNTALAKEAGVAQWSRGWSYLQNVVVPYWLWLPVLALGVLVVLRVSGELLAGRRYPLVLVVGVAVAALAHGVYYVRVGGDFMHARALLPALFALAMPVAVVELPRPPAMRPVRIVAGGAVAVLAVWAVVCAVSLRFDEHIEVTLGGQRFEVIGTDNARIVDARQAFAVVNRRDNPVTPDDFAGFEGGAAYDGDEVRKRAEEGGRELLIGVGPDIVEYQLVPGFRPGFAATATAVGVFSFEAGPDVYVIDVHGLGDPVGGHLEGLDAKRIGHQKTLGVDWIVARFAALGGRRELTTDQLDSARRALSCGQLAVFLDDTRAQLRPGRFLTNLADSFANTGFRVPPAPDKAVRTLC